MRTRLIRQLLSPHWKVLALAFLALLAQTATGLLEPWPLKVVFDSVLGADPAPVWMSLWSDTTVGPLWLLNVAALAVVLIAVVGAVSSYWQSYLSTTVGQYVMHDLRHTLYHHVQRLSLSFYDQQRTGDLVVRLTSDIKDVQDFVSTVVLTMTLDVLTIVGMLAVMMYLDVQFTLIALVVAPAMFIVVRKLTKRIKRASREMKERESDLVSVVQESVSSIRAVKAFTAEEYEAERLDRQSQASVDAALRARAIKARLTPTIDIIVAVGTALVLIVGARFVLTGRLTAGSLLVFVAYLGRMYKPMKDLSKMTNTIASSLVALDRVGELLRTERQVADKPGARKAESLKGRIEMKGVTFGYTSERMILKDISLLVEPGQSIALVGPSGSGKSTLLGLIPRFYDVTQGEVTVDGRSVCDYTLQSLRNQIGLVLQESVLFRAPIWQNISYGTPNATRGDIVRAAQAANAHEFIMKLPQDYDTLVGERGDTLSGGQRQRIAIARALVRNSPILLLDEPSAALDPESEELIFGAMARLMEGRTTVTIAHRLATVRRADAIFVLDDGRIVERGTHDELLVRGGLYAHLHAIQFRAGRTTDAVLS
jgi:subfamily B ATP-binding cassette protein MsbA